MAKPLERETGDTALVEELDSRNRPTGVEAERSDDETLTITEPFDPEKIDVKTRTPTVDLLMKRIKENEIDLMPDFQRRAGIWDTTRKSRLLESILLRIPLPVFYVAANEDDVWSVVDGLQRLTTLKEFTVEKSLRLEGLEFLGELERHNYDKLPRAMQRRIMETEVTVHVIQPGTPATVMFNIFKRINTGGLPLSAQEIRHAILQGPATQLLRTLAESSEFKEATDDRIRDERMADRECVLRFLAFYKTPPSEYRQRDLDSFLVSAMKSINVADPRENEELAQAFRRAMRSAHRLLGKFAFRKFYGTQYRLSPINKALFEAWAVNLAKLSDGEIKRLCDQRKRVLKQYAELMTNDEEFAVSVSVGTGDPKRVRYRFAAVLKMLRGVLDDTETPAAP